MICIYGGEGGGVGGSEGGEESVGLVAINRGETSDEFEPHGNGV